MSSCCDAECGGACAGFIDEPAPRYVEDIPAWELRRLRAAVALEVNELVLRKSIQRALSERYKQLEFERRDKSRTSNGEALYLDYEGYYNQRYPSTIPNPYSALARPNMYVRAIHHAFPQK